jgi:large subunit ribosomal protein L10
MALTKAKKAVQIDHLAHELAGSTSAIVGTFAKLTVSQDYELRKVVRGAGGRYRVLKNKLAARASQGTKVEQALQGLRGVSSVAYTSGDPVALAKALSTWMQDNAEFTFKLGIVDGHVITVEEVKQLATMPSKEAIFAKLLFLINAPAQRLVTVMNATGRDLAVVVNQAVEKGKFAAPAPVASQPAEAAPAAKAVEAKAVETTENSQTAAAATEAPVEGPPVETAPVAAAPVEAAAVETAPVAAAPVEAAAVETAPVAAAVAEIAPAVETVTEAGAESQAEAAATEKPVEG